MPKRKTRRVGETVGKETLLRKDRSAENKLAGGSSCGTGTGGNSGLHHPNTWSETGGKNRLWPGQPQIRVRTEAGRARLTHLWGRVDSPVQECVAREKIGLLGPAIHWTRQMNGPGNRQMPGPRETR